MTSRFVFLVEKYRKTYVMIILIVLLSLFIIAAVAQGYLFPWTGFGDFTKPNGEFVRGKTLWDWMDLFIIPIFLAVGVFLLNRSERKNERVIAEDRQRETAYQTYVDRIAELLLKEKLRTTKSKEVRDVARTRTLSVLRGLDTQRKGMVIQFLHESGLVDQNPIIDLSGADISNANLYRIKLDFAPLDNSNLESANLEFAELQDTNLSRSNLKFANIESANMNGVNLFLLT